MTYALICNIFLNRKNNESLTTRIINFGLRQIFLITSCEVSAFNIPDLNERMEAINQHGIFLKNRVTKK